MARTVAIGKQDFEKLTREDGTLFKLEEGGKKKTLKRVS